MSPKTGQKDAPSMYQNSKYPELMPFQKTPQYMQSLKIAKALNTLPLFGGTNPEGNSGGGDDDKEKSGSDSQKGGSDSGSSNSSQSSSNSGGKSNEDPQKVITELLSQIEESNKTLKELSDYKKTAEEEKTKAERAKLSREEAMQKDLEERDQMIERMDAVIRHVALVNALQEDKNIEWHSAAHVLNELRDDEYEIDIDLESGKATVTGMEKAIARIKKDTPWLIKSDKAAGVNNGGQPGTPGTRTIPSSGRPASGGGGTGDKATRRQALGDRYPVIRHGRAKL